MLGLKIPDLDTISDWQDFGAFISVAMSIVIFLSLLIGIFQIKSSSKTSKIEKAIDISIKLSERFSEVSEIMINLKHRYEIDDTSITKREVREYFYKYWVLQADEWEYFRCGFIPMRIYAVWVSYIRDKIQGRDIFHYYEHDGSVVEVNSEDGFFKYGLGIILRHNNECRDFFNELKILNIEQYENVNKKI